MGAAVVHDNWQEIACPCILLLAFSLWAWCPLSYSRLSQSGYEKDSSGYVLGDQFGLMLEEFTYGGLYNNVTLGCGCTKWSGFGN